jgi:hypothetical protein
LGQFNDRTIKANGNGSQIKAINPMSESTIINNDSPLPIPRQLARWLGLNESVILQQLHWHTEQNHGQIIDGQRWIRMSETEWIDEIPLDEKAIQRAIKNLVTDNLIQSVAFIGRCKWYTINYDNVKYLAGPVDRITAKVQKRKDARASRKEITPPVEEMPAKEQSVPIAREQNVPKKPAEYRYKMGFAKEQNVPLQESIQESTSLLILDVHAREVLDKIGQYCKTNFFNPYVDPYKSNLLKTIREYTAVKVLWAIELALSPEKANGKPKVWGYVLGILESDKNGTYQNGASKNGHNQTYQSQIEVRDTPGSPAPGHAEYANGQGRGSGKTGKSASDALKSLARTGSRAIKSPLPVLPELTNPPNPDIPAT